MIYRHCLFVGIVTPYPPSSDAKPILPYVPILRVCKAVLFEAEPVLYENTFVLYNPTDVGNLFSETLPTPARKLLLRSVELWYQKRDSPLGAGHFHVEIIAAIMVSQWMASCWGNAIHEICDYLTLDRLVIDVSDAFGKIEGGSQPRMAAKAVTGLLKNDFALQTPKVVEVRGWYVGLVDVDEWVQKALRVWSLERARRTGGSSTSAIHVDTKAE